MTLVDAETGEATAVAGWLASGDEPAEDEQRSLFDLQEVEDHASLDARFQTFRANHPEIVNELHRLTINLLDQGYTRIGIATLWEHLRLRTMLGEFGTTYRLNNSYRSRMARHLMEIDPRLEGVFETRRLAEEDA